MWTRSVRDLIMPFLSLDPKPYNFANVEVKDRAFTVIPDPDLVGIITAPNMNSCKRNGRRDFSDTAWALNSQFCPVE